MSMSKAESARINGAKGGRPVGSKTRPQFRDYMDEEQVKQIAKKALELADAGDPTMLKWVGDQIFGRAVQPQEVEMSFPETLADLIKGK